ncbi:glutamate receptor [Citrus sinensis]|uniref:Glutamate receptor n=1 Tax=Citrus sinensis TaxID=2711 RepID=A0ACB8MZG7_CITSI|nr:glutamate receptor [Citrus sinensis]
MYLTSLVKTLVKKHHASVIVGLGTWQEAEPAASLGNKSQVPILSLANEVPSWAFPHWPFLVNAARNQFAQMKAVAAIIGSWQWRKVNIIYEDTNSAVNSITPYLIDALQEVETEINALVHSLPFLSIMGIKSNYSHSRKQFKDFRSRFRVMLHKQYPKEKYREPGIFALQAYDAVRAVALGVKVNVTGKSYKEIRYWTEGLGFSESIAKGSIYNESIKILGQILWPGVVGDTAIVANHSRYAEFSQPYAAPGVQLLVPVKLRRPERAWLFKKPFTSPLWAARGSIVLYNGFVVWLIERKNNEHLRKGSILNLAGTMVSFAFTVLTTRRIGAKVGCDGNSFVVKYLEVLESQPHNVKKIFSEIDYPEALLRGYTAAAFLEVPYVEVFLAKYCNGFITGQIFKVGEFGFVTSSLYK